MFERVALVHYHEIGLKGRNRSPFENRLKGNLDAALAGLPVDHAYRVASRLIVPITDHARHREVRERAASVPGVSYVADAFVTARDMDQISRAALVVMAEAEPYESFRVSARRSATDFPLTSMQINVDIGAHLASNTGKRVDLRRPDATCYVEVVQGDVYVYSQRIAGVGGLPVGTSGTIISLLSAGIDSPVATWRMMKRGAVLVGVHFSGEPQTSGDSARYVAQIGEVLERTGGLGRVYVVPFGDVQRQIALASPPDLRVLLYRRMMIRVAEAIGAVERGRALVTGESLGQVASQTLANIAAVDDAATWPILRPLIGSDKLEIIGTAREIGTLEISESSDEDCCTLFMPRNPQTHATVEEVQAGEADLDIPALVAQALAGVRWQEYRCPVYKAPKSIPWVTDEGDRPAESDASVR